MTDIDLRPNVYMFEVTAAQWARIDEWLMKTVYPPIIARQRKTMGGDPIAHADWEAGYPYQGAIGGAVTYEFTPNSVSTTFIVRAYDKELDLSDYDSW